MAIFADHGLFVPCLHSVLSMKFILGAKILGFSLILDIISGSYNGFGPYDIMDLLSFPFGGSFVVC